MADAKPTKSVFVATPCYGCLCCNGYLASMVGLRQLLAQHKIPSHVELMGNESLIQRARNLLVAKFLRTDCTHLLFVDADIVFNPQSVLDMLEFDKDIVCGIYCKKSIDWKNVYTSSPLNPNEPLHQRGLDFNLNLMPSLDVVDGRWCRVLDSATGMMLISRNVVERMYSAFQSLDVVNDIPGSDVKQYCAIFDCMIDPCSRRALSEDYSFCRRWQMLGGEVWADLASPLAHVGSWVFRPISSLPGIKK